jgi:hypothetical protein
MISVIIHEIGHNFFPMIVNSDERQWGWMDEGIDTFLQYLTEKEFDPEYPSRRGPPNKIVPYMSGNQEYIAPIMSNPENVFQLGPNAYAKPATALNILRETIMGKELFDFAFKTFSERWMFKHPTPEDFFRTMEDASAIDLDWFWRGWFYSTDYVDIGIKNLKRFYISPDPSKNVKDVFDGYGISKNELSPLVFMVTDDEESFDSNLMDGNPIEKSLPLKKFIDENYLEDDINKLRTSNYFYEIEFEKPGGLVMPVIFELTYSDGSKKIIRYPAEIWRKNDDSFKKVLITEKEIKNIKLDPNEETADTDLSNNNWPKIELPTDFEMFKSKIKG